MKKNYKINEQILLYISVKDDPTTGDVVQMKSFHDSTLVEIKQKALDDASKNWPTKSELEVSDHHIITKYSTCLRTTLSTSAAHRQRLLNQFNEVQQKINFSDFVSTALQKKSETIGTINLLRNTIAELKQKKKVIKRNFEAVSRKLKRFTGTTDGIAALIKQKWKYWLILAFILLPDTLYNSSALEILNLNKTQSLTLGFLISVVVCGLAHFFGHSLKRGKYTWSCLCAIVLVPLGLAPAYVQYIHAESLQGTDSFIQSDFNFDLGSITEGINSAITGSATSAFQSPTWWILACVTTGLIIIGCILSYMSPDSSSDFEQNYLDFHLEIPALVANITQLQTEIQDKEDDMLINISNEQDLITPELWEMVDAYESILGTHNLLAIHENSVSHIGEQLTEDAIQTYRHINMNQRSADSVPPELKQLRPVVFPKVELLSNGILSLFKQLKK